jgi:hypothetical protein
MIHYDSQLGWTLYDNFGQWPIHYYCTAPVNTPIYPENQEPVAFESYDSNGADFRSLLISENPAFEYEQGGTWHYPSGGFVLNAVDAGQWGSYVIGNDVPTPYQVMEAGHAQCASIGDNQLYLGYYTTSPLNDCGTAAYGVQLLY